MGQAKKAQYQRGIDDEIVDFLRDKSNRSELDGKIDGITKLILDKGMGALKGFQRPAIEDYIDDYKAGIECDMCENRNVSTLNEYLYVEDFGLCPTCENDRDKIMRE